MRTAAALLLLGLVATPVAAQRRGDHDGVRMQGIPPGHMPPPGECRVWYDDRPPGHQPPPTSCRDAERVASRNPYARVIYGRYDSGQQADEWWDRDDERRNRRPRAVPRRDSRYPSEDPYRYPDSRYPHGRSGDGYDRVPFENGYTDGYDKGQQDARDNDAFNPTRHSRYRSGDHGYERRYGSKDEYRAIYRDGFQAGYREGYRGMNAADMGRRRSGRSPSPF